MGMVYIRSMKAKSGGESHGNGLHKVDEDQKWRRESWKWST
ncbi:hypothetical protein [Bacillus salipaludis]|uniref:Uncharacterized protein n=1 Tax=Bacillus salipaludis TaxID=2547811 RepID=A0AA90R514_9BACI|nr:hypothetical protein [Bacillus salipaludis]MDQ6597446.1 hypothetical protein [Bacillus salipaludis]